MTTQTPTMPTTFQPKIIVKNPPTHTKKDAPPASLAQYAASVVVDGALYRVSAEMTFKNNLDDNRELECELLVPLPQGAMIDGYALDIDGALVDAVPVTKEKARVALESEERKIVDPGIAEHVQGNIFRTRVYPLVDERRVRIDYVAPLEFLPKDAGLLCTVGMIFDEPVDEFSFEILVKDQPAENNPWLAEYFQSQRNVDDWEEMGFKRSDKRGGWLASFRRKNFQPQKNARVILPASPVLEAQFEKTAQGVFLVAPIRLPETQDAQASNVDVALDELTVVWDASASREGAGATNSRESVVLKAALKRFKCKRLRFIPVRDAVDESEIKTLKDEADVERYLVHQLLDLLEATPCDGATNLNAALPYATRDATTLLFSDGLNNWGDPLAKLPETGRVFTFSSGDRVDSTTLKRLANRSGGAYFNLDAASPDVVCDQIASVLAGTFQSARLQTRNLETANDACELRAGMNYQLVAAKVVDEDQPILLDAFRGDEKIASFSYDQNAWRALDITPRRNANLQSYFAQTRLDALLPSQATRREEIEKLGLQFGLATPATSLIVLEDLEQYLKYKICPPESLPTMRAEYLARERDEVESLESKRIRRKERVKRMWQSRLEWYQTEFKPKPQKPKPDRSESPRGSASFLARARDAFFSRADARESRMADVEDGMPDMESRGVSEEAFGCEASANVCYDVSEPCSLDMDSEDAINGGEKGAPEGASGATIRLSSWDPDCDVVKRIAQLPDADRTDAYLRARYDKEYRNSPTFYFACAELFQSLNKTSLAVRILSNLSESCWDDQQLLRPLAKKLLALNEIDLAIAVFERVLEYRPEEPQSYRDLALALDERADKLANEGEQDQAIQEYRRALELLTTVIEGRNYDDWDGRFPEIEVIAIEDACGIVAKLKRLNVDDISYDAELIVPFEIDLRVTLTWSADNTDFDLWLFEPDGTKVFYGARRSANGGMLSCDYMDGYGPEEYLIRKAIPGKYRIEANYFSSRSLDVLGEIYLEAEVVMNFGRPNQKRSRLGFALRDVKSSFEIGEVEY